MALGGVVINGRCVENAIAPDFYYSTLPSSQIKTMKFDYQKIGKNWFFVQTNMKSGLVVSKTLAVRPNLPQCDPAQYFYNGMYLGAVVATAFITVSLTAVLRRAL